MMDARAALAEAVADDVEPAYEILAPDRQSMPVVFASPHSGCNYPDEFVAASRLDPLSLRMSEDSFVDEIFAAAPRRGAPLLRALFPRAYVDANREAFELDPAMFVDELPDYANTRSPRVAAGLGTIARAVASGANIYRHKLTFAEALFRLRRYYWPYHQALRSLIEETRDGFGYCVLVDCHSMPSVGGPLDRDAGSRRVDFILGDRYGRSCTPVVVEAIEQVLGDHGYVVRRNRPYSGGYVTDHYGRPEAGIHAVQIEINRSIYMDERRIERGSHLPRLSEQMAAVVDALGDVRLPPRRR